MSTQILMPALSPTMEEGKLARWLVKEGDTIKSGTILAEIETDKATMEFEAVDEQAFVVECETALEADVLDRNRIFPGPLGSKSSGL